MNISSLLQFPCRYQGLNLNTTAKMTNNYVHNLIIYSKTDHKTITFVLNFLQYL